jgi:hypothetical protein
MRWVGLLGVLLIASLGYAADRLVIHEWGTFTALQDEKGNAIEGINGDEEALPPFVYSLQPPGPSTSKGLPAAIAGVTMRLETPVVYFYPPQGMTGPVDLQVEFRGGALTQFYPAVPSPPPAPARIDPDTRGALAWKAITLGGSPALPATESHVWLAPRDVKAASVTVGKESERYLFYRGVGNIDSPLAVVRSGDALTPMPRSDTEMRIEKLWMYEIRPDGKCAFRVLPGVTHKPTADQSYPQTPQFVEADFKPDALADLRKSMHEALVAEGLFADEATAMLATWEESYFKSPGLRVFFVVARAWTDATLPLSVSVDADITRVMVGRVDVVTPWQRDILARMKTARPEEQSTLYQSLGRFRNALVKESKAAGGR